MAGACHTRVVSSHLMNENEAALRETILTYDNGARAYGQIFQNVDMSKYMNDFVDHLPRAGIVLDNGCGTGRDLEQFLRRGIRTVGLDRSASMLAECLGTLQLHLYRATFETYPSQKRAFRVFGNALHYFIFHQQMRNSHFVKSVGSSRLVASCSFLQLPE